jgi:transposase
VFVIGIDPHTGSHTAAVVDHGETVIQELRVYADRRQRDRLLSFAAPFTPRTWAMESASGLGALLAQQLVAVGETVLDVPPTLSARVRLLDNGSTDKGSKGVIRRSSSESQSATISLAPSRTHRRPETRRASDVAHR